MGERGTCRAGDPMAGEETLPPESTFENQCARCLGLSRNAFNNLADVVDPGA